MGIIDDYFDGYYSEEMIESQVICAILCFRFSFFTISLFTCLLICFWVSLSSN